MNDGIGKLKNDEVFCDICGDTMLELHCKLKCEKCGFFRDCSDP